MNLLFFCTTQNYAIIDEWIYYFFITFIYGIEKEQLAASKLHLNYLMIIAIIGEFCTRWIFGVFDTVVSLYGLQKFNIQPLTFRYILFTE